MGVIGRLVKGSQPTVTFIGLHTFRYWSHNRIILLAGQKTKTQTESLYSTLVSRDHQVYDDMCEPVVDRWLRMVSCSNTSLYKSLPADKLCRSPSATDWNQMQTLLSFPNLKSFCFDCFTSLQDQNSHSTAISGPGLLITADKWSKFCLTGEWFPVISKVNNPISQLACFTGFSPLFKFSTEA